MDVTYLTKHRDVVEIYGLAWKAFTRAERDELIPADESLTLLRSMLEDILRSGERLPYILYDRRAGTGVLLSAYVLSKLGSRPRLPSSKLKRVVEIQREWDWYDFNGETLFALYLLSRNRPDIINRRDILSILDAKYYETKEKIERFEALTEDISRAIFIILARIYERRCEKNCIDFLLNSYLLSRVIQDLELLAIYCCTLARCIRRMKSSLKRERYRALLKGLSLVRRRLRSYLKMETIKKLYEENVIRKDLDAKIELAKHELKITIRQLRRYQRREREKRHTAYELVAIAMALLITIHIAPIFIPQPDILKSVHFSIVLVLLGLAAKMHPDVKRIANWLINLVNYFVKIIGKFKGSAND